MKYDGDSDWMILKEDVELSKMYLRKDFGILDDKYVSKVWFYFMYVLVGMYVVNLFFFIIVKEGYVGEVRNSI